MNKSLGKIERVRFGLGGYQDACIGIHFTLGGKGWGVSTTESTWDANAIHWSEHCKWTEATRSEGYDKIVRYISDLLAAAKVDDISKLVGIPIEATFNGNSIESWRILTEVL